NVISGNTTDGIQIAPGSTGNRVQGNFIGTNVLGDTALPNSGSGVVLSAPDNLVGGAAPGACNVISGNKSSGVSIRGAGTTGNRIQGNYIGTDAAGARVLPGSPQFDGIFLQAPGNLIGGTEPGAGNLISGNAFGGVNMVAPGSGNRVEGNRIGTDA